jgi:hypothetical protein
MTFKNTLPDEDDLEEEGEKVSYQEILSEIILAGEEGHTITILKDHLDIAKRGILNAKSAARKRAYTRGLQWETLTLRFKEEYNDEEPDWMNLTIFAGRKASVFVRRKPVPPIDLSLE